MKHTNIMMIIFISMTLLCMRAAAQITLPEAVIRVATANYKYLKSVTDTSEAQPVRMLQKMAATYDVKKADFYEDDYEHYFISFYIPDGQILAVYDKDGKMLRTVEKYKNIALPPAVSKSVVERFPQWSIAEDIYRVNYSQEEGGRKVYKLILMNGDQRIKVKTNEKGEFL